nr:hypothetical protein GCM10020092_074240 [Actinoplanes digitatis]
MPSVPIFRVTSPIALYSQRDVPSAGSVTADSRPDVSYSRFVTRPSGSVNDLSRPLASRPNVRLAPFASVSVIS